MEEAAVLTPQIDSYWKPKAQIIVNWLENTNAPYLEIEPPHTLIFLTGDSPSKKIFTRRRATIYEEGSPTNRFCWYGVDQDGRQVWSHLIHAEG